LEVIAKQKGTSGSDIAIKFVNNYLLRGVMKVLEQNGFISDFLNKAKA